MNELIALSAVIIVNIIVFLFGAGITGLSYLAYRKSNGQTVFKRSTIGFGLITIGCIVEPIFQFGIRRDWDISPQELLQLQAMEGVFIAIGLGYLFLSITRYRPDGMSTNYSNRYDATVTESRRSERFDTERPGFEQSNTVTMNTGSQVGTEEDPTSANNT